jgi:hypothetical protein
MKKVQILFATALLVAGLGLSAAADCACGSSCQQKGLKAGWFTGAGTMAKAACAGGCNCCKSEASKADAKAGGSCCQTKSEAKPSCSGSPSCSDGKCSGECQKK